MNIERLKQFRDHLASDRRGHKVFDYSCYNSGYGSDCGTSGCARGELPICFPDYYGFYYDSVVYIGNDESITEHYNDDDTDIDDIFFELNCSRPIWAIFHGLGTYYNIEMQDVNINLVIYHLDKLMELGEEEYKKHWDAQTL